MFLGSTCDAWLMCSDLECPSTCDLVCVCEGTIELSWSASSAVCLPCRVRIRDLACRVGESVLDVVLGMQMLQRRPVETRNGWKIVSRSLDQRGSVKTRFGDFFCFGEAEIKGAQLRARKSPPASAHDSHKSAKSGVAPSTPSSTVPPQRPKQAANARLQETANLRVHRRSHDKNAERHNATATTTNGTTRQLFPCRIDLGPKETRSHLR